MNICIFTTPPPPPKKHNTTQQNKQKTLFQKYLQNLGLLIGYPDLKDSACPESCLLSRFEVKFRKF